jgi:UDP-MurNAc hydroxylase
MEITYLGHAGFLVETGSTVVVTDPWLSPEGAFDSAWFQYPCNHHLGTLVREKLRDTSKRVFVYVSHEHRDHFDPEFLKTLPAEKLIFVVPRFERPALREELAKLNPAAIITCGHGEGTALPDGTATLYLDDGGLNRDSALLLKMQEGTLLNLNDCKLYDEVAAIRAAAGPIDVLTCQFSGATWHPTCYEYDTNEYERISGQKLRGKFEMVARAIEAIQPKVYLPSAGPACFLDPGLVHINFEPVNIFPRAPKFLNFLEGRLNGSRPRLFDIMPGDKLVGGGWELVESGTERVSEDEFRSYIRGYAERYRRAFAERQPIYSREELDAILEKLAGALEKKLNAFSLHGRIHVPLYFGLTDEEDAYLRIDFPGKTIERVRGVPESDFYSLRAPGWQISRMLAGKITWEEFALTFRMKLNRKPDVYQTLIQGFLLMEPEDMNWFCERLLEIERRGNRITIEADGTRYSIDRYCPHQGADLTQGWLAEGRYWTCPRHRWQFALDKGGQCTTSTGSIHAVCLEHG